MEKAVLYSETNDNQFKAAKEILNEFKDRLSWDEDEWILDIGCGPGNVTKMLILPILPKSAKLVGIDISLNMVRFAEEKYANDDQLKFITVDFGANNVEEILGCGSFSKAFSFFCLHWIFDQRKSVENIWKILKPGGMALLVLVSGSFLNDIYKLMSKQNKWKDFMQGVDQYIVPYHEMKNPSKKYKILLEDVGFRVLECYDKKSPLFFATVDIMRKQMTALNPFLNRMTPHLQDEYMDSLMDLFVEQNFVRVERNSTGEEKLSISPIRIIVAFCQKIK